MLWFVPEYGKVYYAIKFVQALIIKRPGPNIGQNKSLSAQPFSFEMCVAF